MTVRVRYLSAVRETAGRREDEIELPAGSRLGSVAEWIAANRRIALPSPMLMATLNGRGWTQLPELLDTALGEGDQIAVFPLVSGG